MEQLKPGDRVEYVGESSWFGPDDSRIGTVVRLYQGWEDGDDGTMRPLPYPENWSVSVRVDARPVNWPYGDNDKFAPDVTEVRLVR